MTHAVAPFGTTEIRALTGVRGVAALWVVLFHLAIFAPRLGVGSGLFHGPIVGLGYMAVDLFFVLSGFVLSMTQREPFRLARPYGFASFFVARMFRLYPLHLAVLCVFVVAVLVSPGRHVGLAPYTWENFTATALLVQVWVGDHSNAWNTPSWSIAAELVAYALFPALFEVARRVSAPWAAAALSAAAVAVLAFVLASAGSLSLDHTWRLGIVRCVFEFAAGVFLFRYADLVGRRRLRGDLAFTLGALVVAAIVLFPGWQLGACVGFALVVLACYAPSGIAARLFGSRVAVFMGTISFSIYLVHFVVLIVADDAATRLDVAAMPLPVRLAWIATQLAAIPLVATATWRCIERPGQRLSHRLRQRFLRGAGPAAREPGRA